MRREPEWLTTQEILALHERLLAEHGGRPGLLDEAVLESALASPKHQRLYARSDIFDLAAAYAHALTQDHPFTDGNKRVALVAAGTFLELNGHRLEAPEPDALAAMLALSSGGISRKDFAAWLRESSSKLAGRAQPRRRRRTGPRKKK